MKTFIKATLLFVLLTTVFGCASGSYETRLAPPDAFNPVFMQYKELPGQKVMMVAVDPSGVWAFGYEFNKATIEEATQNAAAQCDKAREKLNVFSKATPFAINDEIVYYKNQ